MKIKVNKNSILNYKFMLIKLAIVVGVIVFDIVTKIHFQNLNKTNPGFEISAIPYVFSFFYVKNTGMAFSMFSNVPVLLTVLTTIFTIIVMFVDFFSNTKNGWYFLGSSFFIGGAIGNLVDRIGLGYVRDFIKLDFINFPIFNIADSFLTVGVILLFIYFIFFFAKDKNAFVCFKNLDDKKEEASSSITKNLEEVKTDVDNENISDENKKE